MSRLEELQHSLDESVRKMFDDLHRCRTAARLITNSLNAYLGGSVCSYFHWENDENNSIDRTLPESCYWENGELIVGLNVKIETAGSFNHTGFKLCLKPNPKNVLARIFETDALAMMSEDGTKFIDSSNGERILSYIFKRMEKLISMPLHDELDVRDRTKFGFPTPDDSAVDA